MEIVFKRISEEAYKEVAPYVDSMLPYISFLGDLYATDINGHHYVLSEEGNKIIIVDNFKGMLDTFCLEFDDEGKISKYIDELFEYELTFEVDGNVRGVRATDKLTKMINQLVYFPTAINYPRINIDFYQYFPENLSSLMFKYDITGRGDSVNSAIAYVQYNYPSRIIINQLSFFLYIFSYEKEQIFFENEISKMYAKSIFKFGEKLFPEFNKRYPKDKVIYALEDMGYKVKIPFKMGDLLCERDSELKQLQLLVGEYKRVNKDKKIQ